MKTYIVTICAIFGGVESTQCFIDKAKAEEVVLNWANQNSRDASFAKADEALKWFENNHENVDYTIQLFENDMEMTVKEHLAEINAVANKGETTTSLNIGLVLYQPASYSQKDGLTKFNGVDVGDDNYYIDPEEYLEDKDNGSDKPFKELASKCAQIGITMINIS